MVFKKLLLLFMVFIGSTNHVESFSKLNMVGDLSDRSYISKYKNYLKHENYNDLIKDIKENKVSKIYINNNYQEVISTRDNSNIDNEQTSFLSNSQITKTNPILVTNLIDKSTETNTAVEVVDFRSDYAIGFDNTLSLIANSFNFMFPLLIILSIISSIARSQMVNNISNRNLRPGQFNQFNQFNQFSQLNPFGKNSDSNDQFSKSNITLNSWAGSPEVIEECKEVISYIENKEKYKIIGAEMPKGILLEGPPGTGKTLLAKAIAGETNSTFISMSGSEFVELFVGMGAARVRELFAIARANRPCIIFIDEIDAVGRQRGTGINMGNDEREQTLNQLLYEMDGFNNNDDIVMIAATNRRDVLDQALLRPGRFDRIIRVPVPDKESRIKIIEYYLSTKNTPEKLDINGIAELTDGFSGAQIKNLINEAAILSVKNNFNKIQEKYLYDAFEKLIVGLIKTNSTSTPTTKLRVAIHESGHSLLALKYADCFDFQKASIQPTYNGAGGYTIFTERPEIKEGGLYTKDILKKRLTIAMGGKAAEAIYYGDEFVSLGAIQDLKQANSLAKRMIGNFGMGNKLEVFYNEDIGDDSNPFLGRSLASGDKYSEYTRVIMDKESIELVKDAYLNAKSILEANREKLIEFSNLLQNSTVIYQRDLSKNFQVE